MAARVRALRVCSRGSGESCSSTGRRKALRWLRTEAIWESGGRLRDIEADSELLRALAAFSLCVRSRDVPDTLCCRLPPPASPGLLVSKVPLSVVPNLPSLSIVPTLSKVPSVSSVHNVPVVSEVPVDHVSNRAKSAALGSTGLLALLLWSPIS